MTATGSPAAAPRHGGVGGDRAGASVAAGLLRESAADDIGDISPSTYATARLVVLTAPGAPTTGEIARSLKAAVALLSSDEPYPPRWRDVDLYRPGRVVGATTTAVLHSLVTTHGGTPT